MSETAKRGREEQGDKALRTPPVNVQITNEVRNFSRGLFSSYKHYPIGLNDFTHNWKLASDAFFIDTIQDCRLHFKQGSSCHQHNVRVQKLNSTDETIIDAEILRLCEKGILEETSHCKGERKKDGTCRLILNLKELNENVEYHHFKMENIQ